MPGEVGTRNLILRRRLDRRQAGCRNLEMPEKGWIQFLSDRVDMLIRRESEEGTIVRFAVVLRYDGTCVTRYDTAHGQAHRDLLGEKNGWIKSVSCPPEMSYNQAFNFALRDFEANHEKYIAFFLEN
jgi:hypothetical protein